MSRLLDELARSDEQRRLDLAREDARMISEMFPLSPIPIQPTDSEGDLQIQMQGYIGELVR